MKEEEILEWERLEQIGNPHARPVETEHEDYSRQHKFNVMKIKINNLFIFYFF